MCKYRFLKALSPLIISGLLFTLALSSQSIAQSISKGDTALSFEDARHLLTRTGFGASPGEISRFIGMRRAEAVSRIMQGLSSQATTPPPGWINNSAPHHYKFGSFSTAKKQKFRLTRLNEVQALRQWWIREMISTPNPQKERLLLFWHSHFATAYSALNHQAVSIARQHMMLRENTAGNFRVLLKSIIRDPAMLNYLDNNTSKKQKPNENLAREIMELFSLGEGSYTESDIKNAARALTGYSFSPTYDMRFVFNPRDHDDGEKTIFGKTGKFNGDDLVDLILEQPEAARYITTKLWRMLISDIEITDARLTEHASAFRNSDYDIKTLYQSLLISDAFWQQSNRASQVKSPVALTVGTIRSTGILPKDWQTLAQHQRQMGQYLFEPPNVAGWSIGASWITPGRLLTRLEWLERFHVQSTTESTVTDMNNMSETMSSKIMLASSAMNMTEDPATGDSMNTKPQLAVRMASEEFDEHVQYRVRVYGKENASWDSGVLELTGGHDTKRLGRIQIRNLPWQTISFPTPIAEEDITAIEVSFINDGATPDGADRNLYISRASIGNRTWLPSDGIQTGKCPRKKPEQQGNIYCPGTLRMEKSQNISTSELAPPDDSTLRVSGVNLNLVRPANKKPRSEIVFTLSEVEFNGEYRDTLNVRYIKHKNGYATRLSSTGCWPKCVNAWPECALQNKFGHITLSLELAQNEQHCMYKGLEDKDKKLAHALWMILDDLYAAAIHDPKMSRPNVARNYRQWQKPVDEVLAELPTSIFYDDAVTLEIVPRPIIDVTLREPLITPTPAGRNANQRSEDLKQLLHLQPDTDFAKLLLPFNTAGEASNTDAPLADILTELSYQLK